MPHFQRGDMWPAFATAGLFLITTNSTIRKDGALVMGRGIARQARDRFPGLAVNLGRYILNTCGRLGNYGLLVSPRWPEAKLGAFQVKVHYSQPASLELIRHSTAMLCAWCAAHPDAQVVVNYPGIGNGRLCRETVLPIIAQLPEQVTIWEYIHRQGRECPMTNPDWNFQVKVGRGRSDTGAHHRAIEIARQMLVIGRWPDHLHTLIVIHNAYDLHRHLQLSGAGVYDAGQGITVYPAAYELAAGQDYEVVPMDATAPHPIPGRCP